MSFKSVIVYTRIVIERNAKGPKELKTIIKTMETYYRSKIILGDVHTCECKERNHNIHSITFRVNLDTYLSDKYDLPFLEILAKHGVSWDGITNSLNFSNSWKNSYIDGHRIPYYVCFSKCLMCRDCQRADLIIPNTVAGFIAWTINGANQVKERVDHVYDINYRNNLRKLLHMILDNTPELLDQVIDEVDGKVVLFSDIILMTKLQYYIICESADNEQFALIAKTIQKLSDKGILRYICMMFMETPELHNYVWPLILDRLKNVNITKELFAEVHYLDIELISASIKYIVGFDGNNVYMTPAFREIMNILFGWANRFSIFPPCLFIHYIEILEECSKLDNYEFEIIMDLFTYHMNFLIQSIDDKKLRIDNRRLISCFQKYHEFSISEMVQVSEIYDNRTVKMLQSMKKYMTINDFEEVIRFCLTNRMTSVLLKLDYERFSKIPPQSIIRINSREVRSLYDLCIIECTKDGQIPKMFYDLYQQYNSRSGFECYNANIIREKNKNGKAMISKYFSSIYFELFNCMFENRIFKFINETFTDKNLNGIWKTHFLDVFERASEKEKIEVLNVYLIINSWYIRDGKLCSLKTHEPSEDTTEHNYHSSFTNICDTMITKIYNSDVESYILQYVVKFCSHESILEVYGLNPRDDLGLLILENISEKKTTTEIVQIMNTMIPACPVNLLKLYCYNNMLIFTGHRNIGTEIHEFVERRLYDRYISSM